MTAGPGSQALAREARDGYVRWIQRSIGAAAKALEGRVRQFAFDPCAPEQVLPRRDAWEDYQRRQARWVELFSGAIGGKRLAASVTIPGARSELSLVDDDTIEREILASRLALAIMDRAASEFTDVRSRLNVLEGGAEMAPTDVLRPHTAARIVLDAWLGAGMTLASWRVVQQAIHDEVGTMLTEAYHEINRALIQRGVMPEVDLRPFIRRTRSAAVPTASPPPQDSGGAPLAMPPAMGQPRHSGPGPMGKATPGSTNWGSPSGGHRLRAWSDSGGGAQVGGPAGAASQQAPAGQVYIGPGDSGPSSGPRSSGWGAGGVADETRMMTRMPGLRRTIEEAQAVIGRLNQLVGQHVPGFEATAPMGMVSPGLGHAIARVARQVQDHFPTTQAAQGIVGTPQILAEFNQRKQQLKEAAETPGERAVIEIVALMFQSILTEERIPAGIRVWFARLQMPVLRVAVAEPDFFSGTEHPARRLIDRMGGCVLGFDRTAAIGDALEKEIKRVVQVVEAYPDTGRRVFQTVLTEFEKFLARYFSQENEASRKGVSLAQQVEQKEIYTVQFTIELRKMLDEVPVQESVRDFLFHVWADVLAMSATKDGLLSDSTRTMKRAAGDLIWSASAKVTREDRAEVIRRLPGLLKTLRDGMTVGGIPPDEQEGHIKDLNGALQAAFTAKTAAISNERMEELTMRLESLEDLLPDDAFEISEDVILDLSGYEAADMEVVSEGGSMPNASMLTWAREIQVGSWFRLDYRGKLESVQLAWQGLRKQLNLFVTPSGRCVLFQQQRLAAFLQAGLLLPAEDEALTVRATRDALAKLDADPTRLLQ